MQIRKVCGDGSVRHEAGANSLYSGGSRILRGGLWEPGRAKRASNEGVRVYGRMKFECL